MCHIRVVCDYTPARVEAMSDRIKVLPQEKICVELMTSDRKLTLPRRAWGIRGRWDCPWFLGLSRTQRINLCWFFLFFFITLKPRVECYQSLWALNTSPPRNRCTFL